MQKVLFISDESPFSFNHSGAASYKTSHLMLLNQLENLDIYILSLTKNSGSHTKDPLVIPGLTFKNISFLNVRFPSAQKVYPLPKTVFKFIFSAKRLTRDSLIFPTINTTNICILQRQIDNLKPDIIWAEHIEPLLLASHLQNFTGKIIYSHHDFLWKLLLIRRRKFKDFIQSFLYYIIQKKAIQKFGKYVVSGASNELLEIRKINTFSSTLYIPTLYPIINLPESSPLPKPLRIIHLGSPKATANRIGVKNLLCKIIPKLYNQVEFKCYLIGINNTTDHELHKLLDQPNVICEGFVDNLESVLRPFDIHILPYNKATGSRTRYSVAMNHGQVLIAHKASVEGIEGLEHNQNCIIKNSFEGMVDAIIQLNKNPAERIRIGKNAKRWHDETHQIQTNASILKQWLLTNNICHD